MTYILLLLSWYVTAYKLGTVLHVGTFSTHFITKISTQISTYSDQYLLRSLL